MIITKLTNWLSMYPSHTGVVDWNIVTNDREFGGNCDDGITVASLVAKLSDIPNDVEIKSRRIKWGINV